MSDLLICIRCHKDFELILDTISSVKWACPSSRVVCAVDNNPQLAEKLKKVLTPKGVYLSRRKFGWGVGLYCMLVESIKFFKEQFDFSHFMSIDTDTLFIARKADESILNLVTSSQIGLIGNHVIVEPWVTRFKREKENLERVFGKIPDSYTPGEGVQGGCMLITNAFLKEMEKRGHFSPPFSEAYKHTTIADDHLISLFCRMCCLEIKGAFPLIHSQWRASIDPKRLDPSKSVVFHPAKVRPGSGHESTERAVRNFYRKQRGLENLQ